MFTARFQTRSCVFFTSETNGHPDTTRHLLLGWSFSFRFSRTPRPFLRVAPGPSTGSIRCLAVSPPSFRVRGRALLFPHSASASLTDTRSEPCTRGPTYSTGSSTGPSSPVTMLRMLPDREWNANRALSLASIAGSPLISFPRPRRLDCEICGGLFPLEFSRALARSAHRAGRTSRA
jgi:hypothetical protein